MRRGLLLLVTVALAAIVLVACLPPAPPPAPAPAPTTKAPRPRPPRPRPRRRRRQPSTGALGAERLARQLSGLPGRQPVEPRRVDAAGRTPTRANYVATIARQRREPEAPRRLRRRRRVRHPVHHRARAPSRRCRSTSSTTATRATPARTRSRWRAPIEGGSDRHVLAVDRDTLQALRAVRRRAECGDRWDGRARARSSTSARTRCAPTAGPRPTPPACRSSPASSATTRSRRGQIDHALRFTVSQRAARLHPSRHALRVVEHRPEPPADGPAASGSRRASTSRATPARPASCSTR